MDPVTQATALRRDASLDRAQADLVLIHADQLATNLRLRADRSEAEAADLLDAGQDTVPADEFVANVRRRLAEADAERAEP